MNDKDFKTENNYREVECCWNCKFFIDDVSQCIIEEYSEPVIFYYVCDKWEHE